MITVVTAYVPIPGHPRSEETYRALGRQLLSLDISLLYLEGPLEKCWLYKYLESYNFKFTHSVADDPTKNSLPYHIVIAQKSDWLFEAMLNTSADVYVWIDYGIFHVPGMTGRVIEDFLKRADSERAIAIPGCWGKDYIYDDKNPCWRFCGGVIVVPRQYVCEFDLAMKGEYIRWLDATRNLSWEVNTMARLERARPALPIWHYKADHNETMFTAYKAGESRIQ